MEIKYLSDGRKVTIVGKLNNVETIVQEIFVNAAGDELPGGERFVTKSLHDQPVISWKEKEEKNIDKRVNELKQEAIEYQRRNKIAYSELQGIAAVLKSSRQLAKLIPEKDLDIFTQFMTGTCEYVVLNTYRFEPPVRLIDKIIDYETSYGGRRFDSIRLLSVCGRSEGKLSYQIHRYSDSSGGATEVHPFRTHVEAMAHLQRRADQKIEEGYFSLQDYEDCIAIGLKFTSEQRATLNIKFTGALEDALKKQQETHDKFLKEQKEKIVKASII